jgi:CRISPR-associated protein Cmr3
MKLRIRANDTLHFGRGKSAARGEDAFATEMFPPYPSVFLGALRAVWLSANPEKIPFADENEDPTRNHKLTFHAMLLDDKLYFPAPADAVMIGSANEREGLLHLLRPEKNDGLSGLALPYYLWAAGDGKIVPPDGYYIDADVLRAYLSGNGAPLPCVRLSDYTEREVRIGIALDRNTRTAAEHMLYNVTMTRTENARFAFDPKRGNVEFAVGLDDGGAKLPWDHGLLLLGSHGKTASWTEYEFDDAFAGDIGENGVFRLYLATPGIFDGGWLPKLSGFGLELLAAAVSGYESVSGYDMKRNKPKALRRAVRAGSVYYYRLEENTSENRKRIRDALHGKSVSEHRAHEGFGICYLGAVKGDF